MAYKLIDGKLTKVKEEERQAAYRPSSPQSQAVRGGGGGKGSAKDIKFADGKPTQAQRDRILASQNDNSFGYYDMNTGRYVPAFIDMFDGGGMNTSGDTFQGAGLYSAALNAMNVAPYGYNRPRTYAQAGMENRPTGLPPSQPTTTTANVTSNELPPANIMGTDANMGVGTMPPKPMLNPNPDIYDNVDIKSVVEPLIQGLLMPEFRQVQPQEMIAMMREQEMRRRNQLPTLLG